MGFLASRLRAPALGKRQNLRPMQEGRTARHPAPACRRPGAETFSYAFNTLRIREPSGNDEGEWAGATQRTASILKPPAGSAGQRSLGSLETSELATMRPYTDSSFVASSQRAVIPSAVRDLRLLLRVSKRRYFPIADDTTTTANWEQRSRSRCLRSVDSNRLWS